MNKLMNKFYENTELSDLICEQCSKLSGKSSKINIGKYHLVFKPGSFDFPRESKNNLSVSYFHEN